jgi:hypothetical protein
VCIRQFLLIYYADTKLFPMTVRIAIVDDHELVRTGLSAAP